MKAGIKQKLNLTWCMDIMATYCDGGVTTKV